MFLPGKNRKANISRNRRRNNSRNKWGSNRNNKIYFRAGLPRSHNKYLRQDVKRMYLALENILKRSANPHTLPQCIRVVAECRLMDNKLKHDLIRYMITVTYRLSVEGILPPMAQPVQTASNSTPSTLHAELPVLGYPSNPYPHSGDDTTQRVGTLSDFATVGVHVRKALVSNSNSN